jgi:DNA-binding MurR/RpiR family transcriptional regulator
MELFESLFQDKITNLTEVQRRILSYMMDNFEHAIFLNASKIAKKAGASEASVVRLAQTLGFDGYPAMQRELQRHFHYRLSTVNRLVIAEKELDDEQDIFVKVMQEDVQNLAETLRGMSRQTFNQAVSDIWSARRVFVLGVKEAHAPALVLANTLKRFMKGIKLLVPRDGDVWDDVFDIESKDLIIGISFPRYARLTVEILKYAHEHGARVGAITDSLVSPLAAYADWVLPARCKMESVFITFTSTMSVINSLITALSLKNTKSTMRKMKELELLWKEKQIYFSRPRTKSLNSNLAK